MKISKFLLLFFALLLVGCADQKEELEAPIQEVEAVFSLEQETHFDLSKHIDLSSHFQDYDFTNTDKISLANGTHIIVAHSKRIKGNQLILTFPDLNKKPTSIVEQQANDIRIYDTQISLNQSFTINNQVESRVLHTNLCFRALFNYSLCLYTHYVIATENPASPLGQLLTLNPVLFWMTIIATCELGAIINLEIIFQLGCLLL